MPISDKQRVKTHIRESVSLLIDPGSVVELRALDVSNGRGYGQTHSGYFNDLDKLAEAALSIDGKAPAVYITLNPINPALLARAVNRLKVIKKEPLTNDQDIVSRHWLPVDIDAVRPAGISSTEEEHQAAIALAGEVRDWLSSQGWPLPVEADSGNGAHLCYRIDLSNDEESRNLVESCLKAIAERFDTDKAKVDPTVHNAARIWKLYGTMTRKGDSTDDRPHRRACLLRKPEKLEVVTPKLLQALVESSTVKEAALPKQKPRKKADDLEDSTNVIDRARKYLDKIPGAVAGQNGDNATYKVACVLAVDFGLSETEALPLFEEWNLKCSPAWEERELIKKLRYAAKYGKHQLGEKRKVEKPRKEKSKKAKGDTRKKRPKFNPINEAKAFRQQGHFIFLWEQIRRYKDGWYQVEDDRVLLAQIAKQINEDFDGRLPKSHEVLETLKNILAEEYQKLKLPESQYINCKNGVLNLDTMELTPHTPDIYFTNQIAANYDLDALRKMQIWPKFLKDILVKKDTQQPDESLANVVQEFCGYCLYRGIPFHKAIMLYGGGSNGKSKLVGVLEQLFTDVTSHVHFEEIGVDVFSTSDLAGALLNISPEISVNACLRDGHVKGIISGDKIRGQRKFQPSFDFKPIAKHIITTNNLPRSNDKSFGFFRRFMIIPFWQTFYTKEEIEALPDTEKNLAKVEDPFIDTKLKSELDAIFTWAVMGLKRLMKHKAFTKSEQVDEMNRLFQIRSRSIEEWTDERLDITDVTQNVLVQVAYRDYIEFCKKLGVPPVANRKFTSELRNLGFLLEKGTQGQIFIRGSRLK